MGLPHCCLECTMPVLSTMNCNLSNMTEFSACYCANIPKQTQITSCTMQKCSLEQTKSSNLMLSVICSGQPQQTKRPQLLASTISSSLIVCIFVTLRCYSNYQISKKFWWDDGFLLLSSAFFICFQSVTIWGISVGLGLHIWNSNSSHWRGLLRFEWSWELIYIVVQTMTKVSVLLLYYRIFPQRWFRRLLDVLIAFMFVHFLIFGTIIVNICHPISKSWNMILPGNCINTRPVGVAGAICSIFEDVFFLSLPVPMIWQLKLETTRKIGIIVILAIGLVACVASIVRLKFLLKYSETSDRTWDSYTMVVLSQIELCLSIVCVCFPAIRLLFSRSTRSVTTKSSMPENSLSSDCSKPSGFMNNIRSIINSHNSPGSMSLPWVSNRAPQLSSIYITSHIELTEKNPSSDPTDMEGYETLIAASQLHNNSAISPDIVHVDKTGKLSHYQRFVTRPFQTNTRQQIHDRTNIDTPPINGEKIGTAR
ncbi:hypothetical protein K3495_g9068 [Podosphaera aphanis]|nr:hypothetical protein K3495_g9068 [Podosphaera aphanis]